MCSVEMEKNSFSELHLVSFLLMILYVLSSLKVTFRVGIQNSAGCITIISGCLPAGNLLILH